MHAQVRQLLVVLPLGAHISGGREPYRVGLQQVSEEQGGGGAAGRRRGRPSHWCIMPADQHSPCCLDTQRTALNQKQPAAQKQPPAASLRDQLPLLKCLHQHLAADQRRIGGLQAGSMTSRAA